MRMIRFAPISEADTPLLRQWLSTPASREWWGEPEHEIGLIFGGEASGESRGFIASAPDMGPFAYIQCWATDKVPDEAAQKEPWVRQQAAGTLGVDITIGNPTLLGKGLGSRTVRAFCDMLFAEGAPRLIIDPDERNVRAVRAYEKAGFRRFDTYTDPDDGSVTVLMERYPPEGTGTNPAPRRSDS
ncbi:MAG: GNAT family N-acetyltransferase [Devosiaceae bacterium]|nr:GNAT family N-acetyltransferase [Devosiaceae bacterium MH13]